MKRILKLFGSFVLIAVLLLPALCGCGGAGVENATNNSTISFVSELSETEVSATADTPNTRPLTVVTGDGYANIQWSAAWANASSTWASGKAVSDYMTVIPDEDDARNARVTCFQAFGEPIIITAQRKDNGESVIRQCDYVMRNNVKSLVVKGSTQLFAPTIKTLQLGNGKNYYAISAVNTGTGTITPTQNLLFSIELTDAIKTTAAELQGSFRSFTVFPSYNLEKASFSLDTDFYKNLIAVATPSAQAYEQDLYNRLYTAIKNNPSIPHAVITVAAQSIYEGKIYSTFTATYEIMFDVSLVEGS